jgi:hypothetical protein
MKAQDEATNIQKLTDEELKAYVDYFNVLIEIESGLTDEQRQEIFGDKEQS